VVKEPAHNLPISISAYPEEYVGINPAGNDPKDILKNSRDG